METDPKTVRKLVAIPIGVGLVIGFVVVLIASIGDLSALDILVALLIGGTLSGYLIFRNLRSKQQ